MTRGGDIAIRIFPNERSVGRRTLVGRQYPNLTTDYAKNYCNRTLIVKVIVENVVTCFLWDTV